MRRLGALSALWLSRLKLGSLMAREPPSSQLNPVTLAHPLWLTTRAACPNRHSGCSSALIIPHWVTGGGPTDLLAAASASVRDDGRGKLHLLKAFALVLSGSKQGCAAKTLQLIKIDFALRVRESCLVWLLDTTRLGRGRHLNKGVWDAWSKKKKIKKH